MGHMNYFQRSPERPQHISVGAVMRNAEGHVLVHHFPAGAARGYWAGADITDFYILMRETLEPNETLEGALARGLAEEFNAVASLDSYLGSIVANWEEKGVTYQKTTLYFLCTYQKEAGERRDLSDAEGDSELVWKAAEELIPLMHAQKERFNREDLDESAILERYIAER